MSDHYIVYATGVDATVAARFANLLNDLRIQEATRVIIGINCLGGNVVAGFGMYNLMLAMPYNIETHKEPVPEFCTGR
jgi:ATP-dependent protease ClpP protease subunit